jgi:hypothetical protein
VSKHHAPIPNLQGNSNCQIPKRDGTNSNIGASNFLRVREGLRLQLMTYAGQTTGSVPCFLLGS